MGVLGLVEFRKDIQALLLPAGVRGFGFRISGLGFTVYGLGFIGFSLRQRPHPPAQVRIISTS